MQSLVYEGLMLAVFGMSTVFVFLTVLVIATSFMSSLILRFSVSHKDIEGIDGRTLAIITAAVHQHRRNPGT